jgi:TRAP-type mannitol/chloroaromatic compound transport system permease small subunit
VINEHSSVRRRPPIYPFKAVIPLAGGVLMLQGVVEILRCIVCIQRWRMALAHP